MKVLLLLLALFCFSCGEDALPLGLEQNQPEENKAQTTSQPNTQPQQVETTDNHQDTIVNIYYRHPLIEGIVARRQQLFNHPDQVQNMKQVVNLLSITPPEKDGLPIWPDNTQIRELYLLGNGTIVVDFDQRFVSSISAGTTTEEFMVYSLVNSLLENFPTYTKVRILIDGKIRETFLGHVDIEFPLYSNKKIYTIEPEILPEDEIIVQDLSPPKEPPNEDLN